MKLNKGFIVHQTDQDSLLVPAGKVSFTGLVRGNKTLGIVLELLKTDTTKEQIITDIKSRFDAPEGAVERDVDKALDELRKIGALDE